MTTRGQFLRSSTPGQKPAAGTRQPGEMWLNFSDKQVGLIDTAKTAQPMIAVRFFSTAANYASGDFVVQAGGIWVAKSAVTAGAFNPAQWAELAYLTDIPALYVLPIASTSVLGGVKIDGTTITISSGVISSAGLVTVSATAPSPVQNGALWYDLVGGQLYAWVNDGNSSQWVVAVNQSFGGVYLPIAGGALTGPLTLGGRSGQPARRRHQAIRRRWRARCAYWRQPASSTATCGSTSETTARAGRRRATRLIDGSSAVHKRTNSLGNGRAAVRQSRRLGFLTIWGSWLHPLSPLRRVTISNYSRRSRPMRLATSRGARPAHSRLRYLSWFIQA